MKTQIKTNKLSPELVLLSIISGSVTLLFSIVYIGLSILAIILRFDCNAVSAEGRQPAQYFMDTLFRLYIMREECDTSVSLDGVTSEYAVFVMTAITLGTSVLALLAAVTLISVVSSPAECRFAHLVVYGYVAVCVGSLAVDLTFASHFGMDHTFITNNMNSNPPVNVSITYQVDTMRMGAIFLMTLCMKGFVGHLINLVLIILIVYYMVEHINRVNQVDIDKAEHSVHKLGAIKAFESQINYGYMNGTDTPPITNHSMREIETQTSDYSNLPYSRSTSWQAHPSGRPFSYLEDVKRPTSPASNNSWRAGPWQDEGPPVPEPDYSPTAPRRLKSALKTYM